MTRNDVDHRPEPALILSRISRSFGALLALDDVTAAFLSGRVHGVLGENGAGKSTLMRIAAGLLAPDRGEIVTPQHRCRAWTPAQAAADGVAMVHQHFMLVPSLTAAENCCLGRRPLGQWNARRRSVHMLRELGEQTGLRVDPNARIEDLSVGERQRVEILRALSIARRVLILDEPTAVLTPQETEPFFQAIKRLKDQGLAIVFISHKLGEVARICDDLTILRRGRRVYSGPAAALTPDDMARYMVGTGIPPLSPRSDPPRQERTILELTGLTAGNPASGRMIRDINLRVLSGQIVGIAGVEGNGQDLLASTLVGLTRVESGVIRLSGHNVSRAGPRERAALGLAHIAEDRLHQALVPGMDLTENLSLRDYRRPPIARRGFLRWSAARRRAAELICRFDVRGGGVDTPVEQLSGGNQQKVVLARELSGRPKLILAHNPVRGLDVAATRFVFETLAARRARGAGILLIHSDLDELLAVADTVYVMYAGRCIPTGWPDCDRETIGRLMLGASS